MAKGPLRDLGPCYVYWNAVLVGPTHGGVKVKIDDATKLIHEDQSGEAPVDEVFTGRKIAAIDVPLTRVTITQLNAVVSGSTKTNDSIDLPNAVGGNMYDSAKQLMLKPIINGTVSVDANEWLVLYKTYPSTKMELGWDNSGQRIYKVSFSVFPVANSGAFTGKFGYLGDTAA